MIYDLERHIHEHLLSFFVETWCIFLYIGILLTEINSCYISYPSFAILSGMINENRNITTPWLYVNTPSETKKTLFRRAFNLARPWLCNSKLHHKKKETSHSHTLSLCITSLLSFSAKAILDGLTKSRNRRIHILGACRSKSGTEVQARQRTGILSKEP